MMDFAKILKADPVKKKRKPGDVDPQMADATAKTTPVQIPQGQPLDSAGVSAAGSPFPPASY